MQNTNDDDELRLQQYRNELRNRLNNVISSLTNLSSLGSGISKDINKAYELIDFLKKYWLGNRYIGLVDVFNLKTREVNSNIAKIVSNIPSLYEGIAKNEAYNNGIYISSVNYSAFSRIDYLPRLRDDTITFDETGILSIKNDADTYLSNALSKIESLNNVVGSYHNLYNDVNSTASDLKACVTTLKTNMDNKMDEAIERFVDAERFAMNNLPNIKLDN